MDVRIPEAEMDVLKALWKCGGGAVRDIAKYLPKKRPRAYTTVQTLLKRLEEKGVVTCEKDAVPHVYRAAISREGLMRARLKSIASELYDGSMGSMVLNLVEHEKLSKKDLDSFRKLIDELDEEGKK